MSGLWTPSGPGETPGPPDDRSAPRARADTTDPSDERNDAQVRAELGRVRAELAGTPVRDLVANHAIGLWQLAILHLGLDQPDAATHPPSNPEAAKLAIDAMASLVEGLGDRLAEHAAPLKEALTSLRIAYVRVTSETGVAPRGEDPEL